MVLRAGITRQLHQLPPGSLYHGMAAPNVIQKARESLGYRLAETLRRQRQEMSRLRAKHADELHVLEAKQAELTGRPRPAQRVDRQQYAISLPPDFVPREEVDLGDQLGPAGTKPS